MFNTLYYFISKDGKEINNYTSGTKLEEDGEYILIATDKAGNTTKIEFKINQLITQNENLIKTNQLKDFTFECNI